MQSKLTLKDDSLPEDQLQGLVLELVQAVNRETDARAEILEGPSESGVKGDPVTLGVLMLTFLSSGAAVALFEVIKAYFERNSSLEMEFHRDDGKKLVIRAENVSDGQIERTMELANEFFDGNE